MPFNTIVLGLDELRSVAEKKRDATTLADIKMMQSAADGMQVRILAFGFAKTTCNRTIGKHLAFMQRTLNGHTYHCPLRAYSEF